MTEISFPSSQIKELIKDPIIALIGVTVIIILILLSNKIINIKEATKKEKKIVLTIVVCIVLLFAIAPYIVRVLYIIDISSDNKAILQAELTDLFSNNTGIHFKIENKTYGYMPFSERENLNEFFVGRLCEIEYYKLSKVVFRIRVIE